MIHVNVVVAIYCNDLEIWVISVHLNEHSINIFVIHQTFGGFDQQRRTFYVPNDIQMLLGRKHLAVWDFQARIVS